MRSDRLPDGIDLGRLLRRSPIVSTDAAGLIARFVMAALTDTYAGSAARAAAADMASDPFCAQYVAHAPTGRRRGLAPTAVPVSMVA